MPDFAAPDDPDTIRIPFIFVPHGHPPPADWLRDHPEAFRVPATMVWHEGPDGEDRTTLSFDTTDFAPVEARPSATDITEAGTGSNLLHLAQASTLLQQGLTAPSVSPAIPHVHPRTRATGTGDKDIEAFLRVLTALALPFTSLLISPSTSDKAEEDRDREGSNAIRSPHRGYTYRAQKSAEKADAITNELLDLPERRVHHLINRAAADRFGDLLAAAIRTGWYMDEPANVITLPANTAAQAKLAASGIFLPVHDNSHPAWNRRVQEGLAHIQNDANEKFGEQSSKERDLFIRLQMEMLQESLRGDIPWLNRVVENESTQPASVGAV